MKAITILASLFMATYAHSQIKGLPGKVKVFIVMGDSNTREEGRVKGDKEGTLEHAVKNEQLYPFMVDGSGNWTTRKDVRNVHVWGSGGRDNGKLRVLRNDWLTVSGDKIGIEIGIGHQLGDAMEEPVLILKSSIGNRSLGWDLIPPGSPRQEFDARNFCPYLMGQGKRLTVVTPAHNDEVRHPYWVKGEVPAPPKRGAWHAGVQYLGDIARAQDVLKNLSKYYPDATEYEVAGFLWWQGSKDARCAPHSAAYEKNLHQLFEALRKEFNAPEAKMVVATLGQTNKETTWGNERRIIDGMFAFGDKNKGEAAVVYTNPLSMGSSSFALYDRNAKTFMNVGVAMGKAMVKLLK